MNYLKSVLLGLTLFLGTILAVEIAGEVIVNGNLCFEGSTDNAFELCLVPTDPGSDLNITVPAATDTMALIAATQTLTNKTVDGESNTIEMRRAATDCTAETAGKVGELCYEQDAKTLYVCEPSAGDCDTAGEWFLASGAASTAEAVVLYTDSGTMASAGDVTIVGGGATSTSGTNVVSITVPANTFQTDDILEIEAIWSKTGTTGSWRVDITWNSNSNPISSGLTITAANTYIYQKAVMSFLGTSSQSTYYYQNNGNTAVSQIYSEDTVNETGATTIAFRVQTVDAADTATIKYWKLTRIRNQ